MCLEATGIAIADPTPESQAVIADLFPVPEERYYRIPADRGQAMVEAFNDVVEVATVMQERRPSQYAQINVGELHEVTSTANQFTVTKFEGPYVGAQRQLHVQEDMLLSISKLWTKESTAAIRVVDPVEKDLKWFTDPVEYVNFLNALPERIASAPAVPNEGQYMPNIDELIEELDLHIYD